MKIQDSFHVSGPHGDVAGLLVDVERVGRCVPGVDHIRQLAPEDYEATLTVQLGPIRPSFKGSIRLDASDLPDALRALAKGTDRNSGSVAEIDAVARLRPDEAGTRVDVEADVTLRGRLGQFGTAVVQSTAQEILRQFAACVDASFTAVEAEPRAPKLGRVMAGGMWRQLLAFFRRLFRAGSRGER